MDILLDILNNIVLILQRYWGLFLEGIGVTLLLSAIAVVTAHAI